MTPLNPYAHYLGDRDPLEEISGAPRRLGDIVNELGAPGLERHPAPGKWCAREILCHLADCEIVFAFRLRQALAQDHHIIQPFDQEAWAKMYALFSAEQALAVFETNRSWNLELIRGIPPEAWDKRLEHPERGEMTFRTVVETMGGHDLNHIRQLEAIGALV
jgi:DinB superfamily